MMEQIQVNANKTCVDEQEYGGKSYEGSHIKLGAVTERPTAPTNSKVKNTPTHIHSNHTRQVKDFLRSISVKIMKKINAILKAPTKMRKASICKYWLMAWAMKKFHTETLQMMALDRIKTANIKYRHDGIRDSIFP